MGNSPLFPKCRRLCLSGPHAVWHWMGTGDIWIDMSIEGSQVIDVCTGLRIEENDPYATRREGGFPRAISRILNFVRGGRVFISILQMNIHLKWTPGVPSAMMWLRVLWGSFLTLSLPLPSSPFSLPPHPYLLTQSLPIPLLQLLVLSFHLKKHSLRSFFTSRAF